MIIANIFKPLLIVAIATMIVGCDGGFHLSAMVIDSEGQVIPGAKFLATSDKSTETFNAISDGHGCISLGSVIAPGKYDFTVSVVAPGYKSLEFSVPTLQYRNYQVVLAKREQAFTSQAQVLDSTQLKSHCGGI